MLVREKEWVFWCPLRGDNVFDCIDGSTGNHLALKEIDKFPEMKDLKINIHLWGCWSNHYCKLTPYKDCHQKKLWIKDTVMIVEECKGSYSKD